MDILTELTLKKAKKKQKFVIVGVYLSKQQDVDVQEKQILALRIIGIKKENWGYLAYFRHNWASICKAIITHIVCIINKTF